MSAAWNLTHRARVSRMPGPTLGTTPGKAGDTAAADSGRGASAQWPGASATAAAAPVSPPHAPPPAPAVGAPTLLQALTAEQAEARGQEGGGLQALLGPRSRRRLLGFPPALGSQLAPGCGLQPACC